MHQKENDIMILLEGNDKISHEEAIKKAEKEFNIYREREMRELQSDFDWKTKYRGDILIHAGKSIDKKAMERIDNGVWDGYSKTN